jgi:hypothetical protein
VTVAEAGTGQHADATASREQNHAVFGPLAVRLCRLQEVRMAGGAVLLLPEGVLPEAGDFYCGWPVIRVPVPEPMIGLPGGVPS